MMAASIGTTSPVRTTMTSSICTRSTGRSSSRSPTRSCATFGARWISAVSSRRAHREATDSSTAPPENINPITTPASSSPSASAPTIATSAIVSTPRLWSTTMLRPTSNASSAASSATAARHTASPAVPEPNACRRPPTTIAVTAIGARIWARWSINQASSCTSRRGLSRGGSPGRAIVGAGAVVMSSRFAASSGAQIRRTPPQRPGERADR